MRTFTVLLAAAALVGCGKGNNGQDTGGSGTNVRPLVEFVDTAEGKNLAGNVGDSTVRAQQATNLLMGAMGLAFADAAVRAKMGEHVDPFARDNHCWLGPDFPLSYFTLTYTDCEEDFGFSGGLIFNDDPQGPVSMDHKSVVFNGERTINGAIGYDAVGASASHWTTYDTMADQPLTENRSPLSTEVEGFPGSITYDGGVHLNGLDQNTRIWGVVEYSEGKGDAVTVLVGGTDPGALVGPTNAPEPASMTFAYETCRCPNSGMYAMDLDFTVDEAIFDIDDLKTEDDGVDDPRVTVEVSVDISGPVEARMTDCGEWEITWLGTEGLDVQLSGAELAAAIDNLCKTAVITDQQRCAALNTAAQNVGGVTIAFDSATLAEKVGIEAGIDFDNAYCRP